MTPATYDITIYEGSDFNLGVTWKDDTGAEVDLTNYSARMHIRDKKDSVAKKDISPYITLGGAAGTFQVTIPASFTLDWGYTSGVYDLEAEDSVTGNIYKILLGKVTIVEEVTYT